MNLEAVKRIVVVIMENRSFDHMLGHLSLAPANRSDVDGLRNDEAWLKSLANPYETMRFGPFHLTDPYHNIDADPPHERGPVANQLGTPVDGVFPMNGFVTNYAGAKGAASLTQAKPPPVMGYFGADEVPVTSFFAKNFAVCDHWFASLPAGTQPNRLMAMSGSSTIEVNQKPLPNQDLVYDWLTRNGVRWRVYHETLPFFTMMPRWIDDIVVGDHFRPLAQLRSDIENDPPGERPQVIFIEPAYADAPHLGECTDDHAPAAIKGGQRFLLEAYRDITSDPAFWAETVMIVTYDEHGGFFDHVSPPLLRTEPPPGAHYAAGFDTLGVRVPAMVISPFVTPGTVSHDRFDHTSILKFIGQKFAADGLYSDTVDQRPVSSVAEVLNALDSPHGAPVIPSLADYIAKDTAAAGFVPGAAPGNILQQGFQEALESVRAHPGRSAGRFAELLAAFPTPTPGEG